MEWVMVVGCVFTAWALLRLVGGERQRQIDIITLEKMIAEQAKEQPARPELLKSR